jgi:hypothetical protein
MRRKVTHYRSSLKKTVLESVNSERTALCQSGKAFQYIIAKRDDGKIDYKITRQDFPRPHVHNIEHGCVVN